VCYGIPSTGNANGVLYNKAVFEAAGITELPKTPDEFIAALQAIKEKTDAIPLYTNYAAGWTMGAWDAYIGVAATGKDTYINQDLPHTANPFADQGNGTGPYAVYKILYDAVAGGLIEEDYTTTDWEGCKPMINQGEIGTMVLGSWAYTQMQQAGDKPEDIGYMAFPITIDGKQYAPAGGDYNFGINVKASDEEKLASMYYLKWLTEESGFAYSEGGVPIDKKGEYPELYAAFEGIDMVADAPALAGEETLMNDLNSESELALNAGGNTKVQAIVEHAFNGDESFDDIMNEWNEAWSEAQESLGVEIK
jgi:ABC-type glycerol-3-phosphate transport system substrate-binding protein